MRNIRKEFIEYFTSRHNHLHLPSSSLIPINDQSLMFTNSGMVQFKNNFLGIEQAPKSRIVTSQQCIRAGGKHNDLDNVGYTRRHHTFFEMLGNFSFGDYFKDEAIHYAWTFITEVLQLSKDKLYVTVYHNDDQAYNIWTKLIDKSRIIRISTNDNFWSMGNTGPCGPCSEIFYDCGPELEGGLPGSPNEDGDRFLELWNLVFMQFNLHNDGSMNTLETQSIDTGAGLERLYSVIEGVYDNYETSLFKPIHQNLEESLSMKRTTSNKHAFNVIADHMRSICALIASGVMPSNVGRGYVLRRIIRRAMRYAYSLNKDIIVLDKLVHTTTDLIGDYHNVLKSRHNIQMTLQDEQSRFFDMMKNGMKILSKYEHQQVLDGDVAFKLYDTYGFPLDMTVDYMKPNRVDVDGFNKLMNDQKAKSTWSATFKSDNVLSHQDETEFYGYHHNKIESKVLALSQDNKLQDTITSGEFNMVLNQTVFYGESGGQKGDIGLITTETCTAKVIDTVKDNKVIVHKCLLVSGSISKNDNVQGAIDLDYRRGLATHHSATHLLHYALRKVLGENITQQGSLVLHNKLRFDFNSNAKLTDAQISQIELIVNNMILENHSVQVSFMNKEKAFESGAIGMFGEKYGDEVRVINIGGESVELCGGTHVNRSGDIGSFYVTKESSISSGIRRIEAVCYKAAVDHCQKHHALVNRIYSKFSTNDIESKMNDLMSRNKDLEKNIVNLEMKLLKFDNIKAVNYKETSIKVDIVRQAMNDMIHHNANMLYVYSLPKMLLVGGRIPSSLKEVQMKSKLLWKKDNYVEIILLNPDDRAILLNKLNVIL